MQLVNGSEVRLVAKVQDRPAARAVAERCAKATKLSLLIENEGMQSIVRLDEMDLSVREKLKKTGRPRVLPEPDGALSSWSRRGPRP